MKITMHFDSREFDQPKKRGCPSEPYPEEWIHERLLPLCETLEVIRAACGGRPVRIISGYRSTTYNAAVYRALNQAPTDSQHTYGRAADIVVDGIPSDNLHKRILELYDAGQLPRLGGLGLYAGFVHVDVRARSRGRLARWGGARTTEQTA